MKHGFNYGIGLKRLLCRQQRAIRGVAIKPNARHALTRRCEKYDKDP